MNINELVEFPTQLVHVETTSINAKKKADEIKRDFAIAVNTDGQIVDHKTGKSVITILINNETYSLEIEKVGIFNFKTDIIDEQAAKIFMETQAIRILWSYVREDIYTITSKMLSNPIMLPTIDVMKTLEKAQ